MDNFKGYVGNGWYHPMWTFPWTSSGYIDQAASAEYYLKLMSDLQAAYTDTVFVYWTMPLTTSTGSENVLRNNYNDAVRAYAAANNAVLFDIADIEAWSPDGVEQTFMFNGSEYQRLYPGYTGDGGHLNGAGSERVAVALYSLFGQATAEASHVPVPGAVWLLGTGGLSNGHEARSRMNPRRGEWSVGQVVGVTEACDGPSIFMKVSRRHLSNSEEASFLRISMASKGFMAGL